MVFSSVGFLFLFLPISLIGYYLLAPRFRNIWLLLISLIFYGWSYPEFLVLLGACIVINYFSGLLIVKAQTRDHKRLVLIGSVVLNLALLGFFKYFNFFMDNLNWLLTMNHGTKIIVQTVVLPLGISFFIFQGLSYIIDVYRDERHVQRNFLTLALYKALFPQLIAGPIVRYHDIEDQLVHRDHTPEKFQAGVRQFIIGLAKKLIVANSTGAVVDAVFSQTIPSLTTPMAWIGIVCYALQIYFDFSGYSDMAIGLAKMFGFTFLKNFDYPYISRTISEFWRRWHISLSSWFRDYLYISLGGNRKGNRRTMINLLVVFFLTGFWHGASWSFVVWGLWHGMFMLIEKAFKINKKEMPWYFTFYALLVVLVGWVFFRSPDLQYAIKYIMTLFGMNFWYSAAALNILAFLDTKVLIALGIGIVFSTPYLQQWLTKPHIYNRKVLQIVEQSSLMALFVVCIFVVTNESFNPFLYFRF